MEDVKEDDMTDAQANEIIQSIKELRVELQKISSAITSVAQHIAAANRSQSAGVIKAR